MRRFILAFAAVAVAVALTGAQTANARTTCAEGGRVLTVWTTQNGDVATLRTTPQGLITVADKSGPVTCNGAATTTYVDTILIDDLSDDPATAADHDGAIT